MTRIYQAGPLFSLGERLLHRQITDALEAEGHEVLWPGDLVSDEDVARLGAAAIQHIFDTDRQALDSCDIVVALLDGTGVDDGTAWELGYAYAHGKPCYGLRTDWRNAGETRFSRVNAMIEGACVSISTGIPELLRALSSLPRPRTCPGKAHGQKAPA